MYTNYEPSSLGHTILALIFYVVMLGFAVYSFLALYSLNKHGRSKMLAITVSVIYLIIAASMFAASQINLNKITF